MTASLDKLAGDIVGAIFDDYEDERIMSRERWEGVVKKIIQSHVDKLTPGYGGFGVAGFMAVGDGIHVYRMSRPEHPLLPDAD